MNSHRHLSEEEICDQILEAGAPSGISGCGRCEAEAASVALVLTELRRADASLAPVTEWDDLLLARRIREAVASEKPYSPSIFDRFAMLRPALASALVASLALAAWIPLSQPGSGETRLASTNSGRLPAWSPLPDESEDEGLAVLAEWNPNEDEVAIAGCHAACFAGLSSHEEENLLRAVAGFAHLSPITGASPQ